MGQPIYLFAISHQLTLLDERTYFLYSDSNGFKTQHHESFMPGTYAHLMITEKALERFRGNQDINEKLRGSALTHSHFVHLGSIGPDYPYLDIIQPKQKDWADHMHYRHTGDVIKTMTRKLLDLGTQGFQKEEFIIPFCWTLGYLSHVTSDLVVHPVVSNIVGPYKGNETQHRNGEMIQDTFIYHQIRRGAEIEHSALMKIIEICSNPDDKDKIHPILLDFWRDMLKIHFPVDYQENRPEIDEWHDQFEDWIKIAGRPVFVGRFFDPQHKFTYKKSIEITPKERETFLDRLPLPDGKFGTYERDVFPKVVEHVTDQWVFLSKGIFIGNINQFLSSITNCDLDTGRDLQTGNLVYWS
jgi:hypothetical protein